MALICGCLTQDTVEGMIEAGANAKCDILEARLDFLKKSEDVDKLSKLEKPVISTCMPSWDGGRFTGPEEDRTRLLESSLEFSDYITLELNTDKKLLEGLISKAKEKDIKVIIAFHDFEKTPTTNLLKEILDKEFEARADVGKIACMPTNQDDVLRLMSLLCEQDKDKTILLSMGELGKLSRVIAPALGSLLTYGYISGEPAGPGQLSVEDLAYLKKILW